MNELKAEAADWVIRLGSETVTESDRERFASWMARSEDHRAAFAFAERTWSDLTLAGAEFAAAGPGLQAEPGTVVPLAQRSSRRQFLWRAAAGVAVTVGGAALFGGDLITAARADVRTGIGERRDVKLPDGTLAYLNTDTAIGLDFSSERRVVTLLAGEAVFETTGSSRPFSVSVRGTLATTDEASLHARRWPDGATLSSLTGTVEVEASGNPSGLTLGPGQTVRLTDGEGAADVTSFDAARVLDWRKGRLRFDGVPLRDAVAEINRYRTGQLVVLNPDLAERAVSGLFLLDRIDSLPALLADELGAQILDGSPFVTALY